jgi:hypothetical protein
MPQKCTVCAHPKSFEINEAMVEGCRRSTVYERIDIYVGWYKEIHKTLGGPGDRCPECLLRFVRASKEAEPRLRIPASLGRRAIPRKVRSRIIARDGHTCSYCGGEGDLTHGPDGEWWRLDHVMPVSRGGSDEEDNLALACAGCNIRKSDHVDWGPDAA